MNQQKLFVFFHTLNRMLVIGIACISLYIVLKPILPGLMFSLRNSSAPAVQPVILDASLPVASRPLTTSTKSIAPKTKEFGLSIPSLQLDSGFISSYNSADLWKGIWHKQETGNPEDGGNMVITAHRFLYTGQQDTFYHLPSVAEGEIIEIYWNNQVYLYRIYETFEVTPDKVEIEDPTFRHVLTLYTCTPLWSNARRFVVRAEPLF